VVIIGPPGSGKTTVGRVLAALLGVELRDTDEAIEAQRGRSISDIFVDEGEPAFRELERAEVASALSSQRGVLSLGGGAVMDPMTAAALTGHTVVFLDVGIADAATRVGFNQSRPLLAVNPRAQWTAMMNVRRPTYERLATFTVLTTGRTPQDIAAEIVQRLESSGLETQPVEKNVSDPVRIRVGDLSDSSYDVVIGHGLLGELAGLLGAGVERVLVIHSRALAATGQAVRDGLVARGLSAFIAEVPDGEEAKSAEVAASLWAAMGRCDLTRSDAVVGVGGGTVTDLAGFVAATWLRGVTVVQVPTTLLAMVDAAVGGKTGINTAQGKNLVGAFHSPAGVLCDLAMLETLPAAEFVSGMAEVIKCGFIVDPVILDLVEADPHHGRAWNGPLVSELIQRSVVVKAQVVTKDPKESSLREILNYGHTFAHAIEQVEHFSWRHGDAVAVGMVYAAELAALADRLEDVVVDRHRSVLAGVGLPISYRGERWPQLYAAMRRDKKSRGSLLRFVVLDALCEPGRLEGPDESMLQAAYARVCGD
jgi:3-dehydroquinate synthase